MFPLTSSSTETAKKLPMRISCLKVDGSVCSSSISSPNPSRFARGHFIYQQIRSQFSHDIWWLSLAVLLITVAESDHYKSQPVAFSTFNIIFEVVSAYSCVGVSIGYPGKNYAFCGEWHTFSKLLLAATSLKGRHRNLPVSNGKYISFLGSWERIEDMMLQGGKTGHLESSQRPSGCV